MIKSHFRRTGRKFRAFLKNKKRLHGESLQESSAHALKRSTGEFPPKSGHEPDLDTGNHTNGPFRFLDLPGEIRKAIYVLTIDERDLRRFSVPGNGRVPGPLLVSKGMSQEFRHELRHARKHDARSCLGIVLGSDFADFDPEIPERCRDFVAAAAAYRNLSLWVDLPLTARHGGLS